MALISGGGGGGSSAVLSLLVTLTSADILALNTTPFTLVTGQAGKVIVPLQLVTRLHAGTQYAGSPAGRLFIGPTIGTSGWGANLNQPFGINQAADSAQFNSFGQLEADAEPLTLLDGKDLRMDVVGGAFTAGTGTLDAQVLYSLLAT